MNEWIRVDDNPPDNYSVLFVWGRLKENKNSTFTIYEAQFVNGEWFTVFLQNRLLIATDYIKIDPPEGAKRF